MKILKLLLWVGFVVLMAHSSWAYLSLTYENSSSSTTLSTSNYSNSDRGIKYTASTKRLELSKKDATYTLSGTANDGTHVFVLASGIILRLDGVQITVPDATKESPIRLRGCDATVVVKGDSVLKGSVERAGIGVNPGQGEVSDYTATLTLKVNYGKTLTVTGGDYAAGIGGNKGEINGLWMEFGGSGKLVARGGKGAPGIGSGYGASTTRKIVFSRDGLDVEAIGGAGAAGIGGGSGTIGAPVYNYGAHISATGKGGGAGIGGGKGAAGGSFYNYLTVPGCEVVAVGAYESDLAGTSCAGAGIGAGYGAVNAGTIVISNGTVNASSMSPLSTSCGAGIGGGGGTPTCSGSIRIIGGIVTASATFGAAIGGGYQQVNPTISIEGGKVSAMSTLGGAGIGSGYNNTSKGSIFGPIAISGGRVTATGVGGGAGIGGGCKSDCAKLTISGGTVDVCGSGKAYDFGAGEDPYSDTSAKVITGGNVYCRNGRYPSVKDAAGNQIGPMKILLRPDMRAAENMKVYFNDTYEDSNYGQRDLDSVNDYLWLWFHPKSTVSPLRLYWCDTEQGGNWYQICQVETNLEYDAKIGITYYENFDNESYSSVVYHDYTKNNLNYKQFPLPSHERSGYAFAGWCTDKSGSKRLTDNLAITNVYLYAQYLPTVDIQAALDNSVLSFTRSRSGHANIPYGQKQTYHYGNSAIRFGESSHSSTGNVDTVVYGPGKISFDWKQSCEYGYDYLELLDISTAGTSILKTHKDDSSTAWKTETCTVAEGRNVLRWQYRRDQSVTKGDNIAYLDHVVWMPRVRWTIDSASSAYAKTDYPEATPSAVLGALVKPTSRTGYVFTGWYTASSGGTRVTPNTVVPTQATDYYAHWTKEIDLGVAFGDTNRTITTGATSASDARWQGQSQVKSAGAGALRSGAVESGHSTWFETKVSGTGTATFKMRISANMSAASLKFYVDGAVQQTLTGVNNSWGSYEFSISTDGEHTLRWTFAKTGSAIDGEDCAWVADFAWTPTPIAKVVVEDDGKTLRFVYDSADYGTKDVDWFSVAEADAINSRNRVVPWYDLAGTVTQVVFNSSFASYRPKQCARWFYEFENLKTIENIKNLNISAATSLEYLFSGCSSLTSLDVTGFDTANATVLNDMFRDCSSLTSLDVTGFNTSKATDMSYMFSGCSSLTSLDVTGFDTSKVTDLYDMFSYCSSLKSLDVRGFDTANATRVGGMFQNCSSLKSLDVTGFNTAKATDMGYMFYGCSSLKSLDVTGFKTAGVSKMYGMFYGCSSLTQLDVTSFDTKNAVDMGHMFSGCSSLVSLDVTGFNTESVSEMNHMFSGCSSLTALDVTSFDTAEVEYIEYLFSGCSSLTRLDVSNFNTVCVKNMESMFSGCSSLKTIVASDKFVTTNVKYSCEGMFTGCMALKGGAGTTYDSSKTDKTYARMDGGASAPGYFTASAVSGYAAWAAEQGLAGAEAAWDATPAKWGGKWANAFIYTFGEELADGTKPLMAISFDANGKLVITTAPVAEGRDDFTVTVIGAPDLRNWSAPVILNKSGNNWTLPANKAANFFKVRLEK